MAPPKPRLVLRIGVTGHRPNRFEPDAQARVAARLTTIFRQIAETVAALHARHARVFSPDPPEIRLVSALAEGADRVVAEVALKAGFRLDVILPFSPAVYAEDFATPDSKSSFAALLAKAEACFVLPGAHSAADGAVATRAYEAVGLMTLRQTDLIIAVWDGRDAAGRGGTGAIVQSALASGQPVLRFNAAGEGPFLYAGSEAVLSDARDVAGRVTTTATAGAIEAVVERLCAPPGAEAAIRLRRFLGDSERRLILTAPWHPLVLSLFSRWRGFWRSFRRPPYVAHTEQDWQLYHDTLKNLDASLQSRIDVVVLKRFAWADGLADHYGQLHRSGYISNYLLSALAVAFAALGDHFKGLLPALEIAAIVFIAVTVGRGHWGHWHTRWLDYRALSGQLRALRALVLTGSATGEARSPRPDEPVEPASEWTSWYARVAAREVGLPNFTVDTAYVEMVRGAVVRGEIDDQIAYHTRNAERMESVHHWLDRLSHAAFGLTFLACAFELAVKAMTPATASAVTVLCVVLPAFGAALFGIGVHGEFAASAERSRHMVERLGVIGAQLKAGGEMSFATVSALTEYAALTMAGELGSWRVMYRARPLALPA